MLSAIANSFAEAAGTETRPRLEGAIVAPGHQHALTLAAVKTAQWQRRTAIAVLIASGIAFLVAVPFAKALLLPLPAFIPAYEAALLIVDLITAVLLFGQFAQQRSAALLALGAGYLFDAFLVIPHALSYPGVLSATGWLGAGPQTTAWLYMFWHGGFPIFVIAYALLRPTPRELASGREWSMIALVVVATAGLSTTLTLVAVNAQTLLPAIMDGNSYTAAMKFTVGTVWALSLIALLCLARRRPYPVLDLWLMVVMFAWLLDIALSAALNGQRFDLGFYAGRLYGLLAATFVLGNVLIDMTKLHGQLILATTLLEKQTDELDRVVRQRTAELESSNRRLAAVLEASPVGIFMINLEGRVVLWTPSAERIFGYTEEEAIGNIPPYLTDDDYIEDYRANVARSLADPAASGFLETRRRRKDGTIIDVSVRWARVNDQSGAMLGLMYTVGDHTEIKKIELQLRQAQKMEAVGNLTGGMAHDFNNLLGIVIGNLDLLLDGKPEDPEVEELSREALEAALRGADLTRRLLAFARKQPLQPERTNVNTLVSGVTQLLSRTLGEDVSVALELGTDIWPVVVDPAQLESSLINLANNARDAMPGGGRLIITTSNRYLDDDYASQHSEVLPGDYALIEVSDTGTGMPPDVASRIFEPFFTTKEQGKGTGLGLSMVFGFMKQSGGHLNVYSEPGIGTTFRLYLPRALAKDEIVMTGSVSASIGGQGETVLAVEDNPGLRRVVVRQLTELGYRVLEAENAQAALDVLESEEVDLLLSDVVMPGGIGGGELARTALSRWPHLKVLLTSGFPENRIGDDPSLLNIRLLSKPYRREDLASTIRSILTA